MKTGIQKTIALIALLASTTFCGMSHAESEPITLQIQLFEDTNSTNMKLTDMMVTTIDGQVNNLGMHHEITYRSGANIEQGTTKLIASTIKTGFDMTYSARKIDDSNILFDFKAVNVSLISMNKIKFNDVEVELPDTITFNIGNIVRLKKGENNIFVLFKQNQTDKVKSYNLHVRVL